MSTLQRKKEAAKRKILSAAPYLETQENGPGPGPPAAAALKE